MTREEAIAELTIHLEHWKRLKEEHIASKEESEKTIKAIDMAIEALSQPIVCTDFRIAPDHIYCAPEMAEKVVEALHDNTNVQNMHKGEWIKKQVFNLDLDVDVSYIECDQCGHRPYFGGSYRPKYCEECGAKMDGNTYKIRGFTADEWYRDTFGENDGK